MLFKALSVPDFENEFEIFCFYAQKCKAVSNKSAGPVRGADKKVKYAVVKIKNS